jgi:hypothetical protein
LTGLVPTLTPVAAQTPPNSEAAAPTDAQVHELEQQITSLRRQLDEINSTKDAASRQRIMQKNWQGMQDYMGQMHGRWGMGSAWMMGPGMMRGQNTGSGMMMGCPMMDGSDTGWMLPKNVSPEQYGRQMREHMQMMQEEMHKIAQTTDPQERQRLMQEHWQSMYQDMQTMNGNGWMWSGPMMGPGMMHGGAPGAPTPSATPLPDPDSTGAKLVSLYCTQCHAAPQPTLHTTLEWTAVTQRMREHMNSGWQGIKTPSTEEMKTILVYMRQHAR